MCEEIVQVNVNLIAMLGISLVAFMFLGVFVLIGIKIAKGGSSKRNKEQQAEEARLIQEIYQGLERMQKRVEALETIMSQRDQERIKA